MTNQPTKDERVYEHLTKAIVTIFEAIDNPHQPRTAAVETVVGCLMAAMAAVSEGSSLDDVELSDKYQSLFDAAKAWASVHPCCRCGKCVECKLEDVVEAQRGGG